MKIPEGMTEQEVIDIVTKIAKRLSSTFRFGYNTQEDIEQEAFIFAMEAIEKYTGKHPLPNFLNACLRNKLKNHKRNKYKRNDPPCKICMKAIDGRTTHKDGLLCEKYMSWHKQNKVKENIINTVNIGIVSEESQEDKKQNYEDISINELVDKIDNLLPLDMRVDYIKIRDNVRVPKARMKEIEDKVREILGEDYV